MTGKLQEPSYRDDIILASASPRRREMFAEHGIPFEVCPADVDEELPFDMEIEAAVMFLAFSKAIHVAQKRRGLIISADTVVAHKGRMIGKPADREEAFDILAAMRKDRHDVITGVCIIDNSESEDDRLKLKECIYDRTRVYFGDYSDDELTAYVNTSEPYDKAGGYAIQMTFGKYIEKIDGDRDNVIGFPMYRVEKYLR